MEDFTKIIIAVSLLILIIYFVYQWISYKNKKDKLTWPPKINPCPDYWINTKSGNLSVCKNKFNLGKCAKYKPHSNIKEENMDFNKPIYKGKLGNYNKCMWSKKCKVTWDGIDNICIK